MEVVSDQPWARVSRDGDRWLKECRPVQAYEVPLTVALASRWADRLPPLLDYSVEEAWLLLGDAGTQGARWEDVLPLYVELQRGELPHVGDHLARGVPDLRPSVLPVRFEEWAEREPRLAPFAARFTELCASLTRPPTVQHDDLHEQNLYTRDGRIVILDWGDTCIAHPFATLYIACRWVAHFHGQDAARRIRATYLDCWEGDVEDELERVLPVAAFARLLQWERIGEAEPLQLNLETFLETIAVL
jgi:hypothetical protein